MKGISPLVASIFLVAITMIIAGILAYWASTFVKTQTTGFENKSIATDCNFGNFKISKCSYSANTISLILENVGQTDLSGLIMYVTYSNNSVVSYPLNQTLKANELKSFSVGNVSSDYSLIKIFTQCPLVREESGCK